MLSVLEVIKNNKKQTLKIKHKVKKHISKINILIVIFLVTTISVNYPTC